MRIRTKLATLFILAALTVQASYPQGPSDVKEEPPVTADNPGFLKVGPGPDEKPRDKRDYTEEVLREENRKTSPDWRRVDAAEMSKVMRDGASDRQNPKPYMYKVRVKNNKGSKAIVAVKWTYVFLDPITRKELLRHSFDSKTKIEPGKEKELFVYTDAAPPSVVNARAKAEKGKEWLEEVIIERVEYADRTSWEKK